ncbi:protein kinase domain-containing protein [Tundrisphaera lichenicola]|uniref:protein kinase domain-containing protein n=1 Tax=Tundrisphaera lichenicola TaxID=2029860 RepID=UPI003EC1229C
MRVILDVVEGPRKGQSFVFDRHDTFIVGRSRFVHCPMPEDSALSRDHFLVEVNPPRCDLRDLGSTNGTFVNDRKVDSRIRLNQGDKIEAGQSIFAIRIESSKSDAEQKTRTVSLGPGGAAFTCDACGVKAPPGIDIANDADASIGDSIQWLCDLCRGEVATSPQPVPTYTTIRQLGRGGMGVVFQARNNLTGRMVALKLIVPESAATRSAIDRFLREMSVISQLKHPNIVEWLEQGMTRGQFWFTMEYVAGTNLEALANEDPGEYPIRQACRMASQVLKGLEHAHALGFVHRDIKPENILIGQSPTGLLAKISDFGLAKSFRGLGLSGLTFSGEMRGTIPFMPPEQMLDFKAVQPIGDLYSTAATLYYLISGQFIYDEVGEGGDLIRMLLEEPPVPIQKRRPEVPTALANVLTKGLARDPADRYQTATELRKAIRPFC